MVKNLGSTLARLARIPARVKAAGAPAVAREAQALAEAVRRAAPVDETAKNPGALRDSVHVEDGRHELNKVVVVDGKDEHGHVIAKHVETGHRSADGSHVSAHPFAGPTARARKRPMRRRLAGVAKKAFLES